MSKKVIVDGNFIFQTRGEKLLISTPKYSVENISSPYGFFKNNNGYYENNNKRVDNSWCLCKITFNADNQNLFIDCIADSEKNYDYALISYADKTLENNKNADTVNVWKNLKGTSGSITLNGGKVNGEHFICIKYIKDSSSSSGTDSFQFKIRLE